MNPTLDASSIPILDLSPSMRPLHSQKEPPHHNPTHHHNPPFSLSYPPSLPHPSPPSTNLKHQRSPLRLLIAPQLKMLAPLEGQLRLSLAIRAFKPQHHLLRRLCFLVEDGLRLAAVAGLFAVVAALALGD